MWKQGSGKAELNVTKRNVVVKVNIYIYIPTVSFMNSNEVQT